MAELIGITQVNIQKLLIHSYYRTQLKQVIFSFGWTGSNGDTPELTVTIPKGSTGDKYYIANWSPITYTIVYDGNGATSGNTESSTHTYDESKRLSPNGYTKQGYTFKRLEYL